jgi:PKD repeat protein
MRVIRAFLPVALLLLTFSSIRGAIIHVPADQPSIQAGIDAAVMFDTVLVAPGTYLENIIFKGKRITVSSHYLLDQDPKYIFSTIIDGSSPSHPDTASVVRMVNGENNLTVLQGFTITGGKGTAWTDEHGFGVYREGGGILCTFSSPVIRCNYIAGNEAIDDVGLVSAGGGGIRIGDGDPQILNNIIVHNKGKYGAGVVLNFATGVLRNNVIAYNTGGQDYSGSGIWKYAGGTAIIENNTIAGNVSTKTGAGIYVWSTKMNLRNNVIWGNVGPGNPSIGELSAGTMKVTYNDVEGGYTGEGNVDIDPQLTGEYLYLMPASPCIDAGDTVFYETDPEDPSSPGSAWWPAQGGLRSDMGAYGGPGSKPLELVAIVPNTTAGWVPLTIDFTAYSHIPVTSWDWDFGDGGGSTNGSPNHEFAEAGVYDVALTVDTGGGTYEQTLSTPLVALADTMAVSSDSVRPNSPVGLSVTLRNNVPLTSITIPVSYDGDFVLRFDSVSVAGCRTGYFESVDVIEVDTVARNLAVQLQSSSDGTLPELSPGVGPIINIYLTSLGALASGAVTPISLNGWGDYTPDASGSLLDYAPATIDGEIVSLSCCVGESGNVDNDPAELVDIGDLTRLIDYLYISGTPPECLAEANVDGDAEGLVDIGDLTAVISYLYIPPNPVPAVCQ